MNLKELSKLLGLSQTTVSRALNGYPEVSEATRVRVVAAAQAHNYSPNTRAQGLATGHSRCIGHVIAMNDSGETVNPIFGDFMAGAGETYARHGYDMMITRVNMDEEAYRTLKARGTVDGVVVHAPRQNDPRIKLLMEIDLPFVVHGRSTGSEQPYSWLDVNNTRAFQDATDHLLSRGHRRIALINGEEDLDFAIRRRTGYEQALTRAGLPILPDLMSSGEMTEGYGHAQAHAMLDLPDPASAFLTSSIISATGIRRALQDRGLTLGTDVSVLTFDDCLSYFGNGTQAPIFAAMRSSVRDAGAALAQMLIDRITAPDRPPMTKLWEADFIPGPSVGPCPVFTSHAG